MAKKILFTKSGDSYVLSDLTVDFHSTHGFVKADKLQNAKPGEMLTFSKGEECWLSDFTPTDEVARIKRGAQIILPKDAGLILAQTLVDKDCTVIDAGSGSGALTCFLARYVKKVYSHDIKPAHLSLSQKNAKKFGLTNIEFSEHNVYEGFVAKPVQLITLDVPEPWHCLAHAYDALDSGRYLVCYVPCINQVHELIKSVVPGTFIVEKSVELLERYWKVTHRAVRPETQTNIHTGFLVFLRKI